MKWEPGKFYSHGVDPRSLIEMGQGPKKDKNVGKDSLTQTWTGILTGWHDLKDEQTEVY